MGVIIMSQRREGTLLGTHRVLDLSGEKGVLCGKVLAVNSIRKGD